MHREHRDSHGESPAQMADSSNLPAVPEIGHRNVHRSTQWERTPRRSATLHIRREFLPWAGFPHLYIPSSGVFRQASWQPYPYPPDGRRTEKWREFLATESARFESVRYF